MIISMACNERSVLQEINTCTKLLAINDLEDRHGLPEVKELMFNSLLFIIFFYNNHGLCTQSA